MPKGVVFSFLFFSFLFFSFLFFSFLFFSVHAAVIWLLVTQQAFDSVFLCVCADANDAAQFAELKTQGDLTRRAWERDVQVSLHYSHFECLNALNRRPQATKHLQTTAKHEYCRRSCICAWRVYRLST